VCCSVLPNVAVCCSLASGSGVAVCCSVLQCVAVCCSVSLSCCGPDVKQCAALYCSVLLRVAVCRCCVAVAWQMYAYFNRSTEL